MEKKYNIQLGYHDLRAVEKLLESELEYQIFELDEEFDIENVIWLIHLYRQFRDAADLAADDIYANASREEWEKVLESFIPPQNEEANAENDEADSEDEDCDLCFEIDVEYIDAEDSTEESEQDNKHVSFSDAYEVLDKHFPVGTILFGTLAFAEDKMPGRWVKDGNGFGAYYKRVE